MNLVSAFSFYNQSVYPGSLFQGSSPRCVWCCCFGTVVRQPIMTGKTQQAVYFVVAQKQREEEEWYSSP